MDELYELKEMLCKELKSYGEKGEMSAGSLEIIDKLAHAIKNLDKIIDGYDDEHSYDGVKRRSYRGSYARGRGMRRDAMGRYSSGYSRRDLADDIRGLMNEAPDERTRAEMERLVDKLETR